MCFISPLPRRAPACPGVPRLAACPGGGWALSLTLPVTKALCGVHVRPARPPGLREVNCMELSPPPPSEVVPDRLAGSRGPEL